MTISAGSTHSTRLGATPSSPTVPPVDGLDPSSPDALLEAASRLATRDRVRIDVVRGDTPITLEYELR